MKHRNRLRISKLISLLTVQFNVTKTCYEFKPNTKILKTCVNAKNIWITQENYLEITNKKYGDIGQPSNDVGSIVSIFLHLCVRLKELYKN